MCLKSDAMSEGVREVFRRAMLREILSGRGVKFGGGCSRLDSGDGPALSFLHQIESTPELVARVFADPPCPGLIRAIAVQPSAHVDEHRRFGFQTRLLRSGVRQGRIRAKTHDGCKTQCLGPVLAEFLLQPLVFAGKGVTFNTGGISLLES